jgi:hypothetical protein
LVAALLPVGIKFHLLRVVQAVLFPIARVSLAPFVRTLPADLPVKGVDSDLMPVIIAPALPLALRLAANELLGMIWDRLKDLLTVKATAITHQAAPNQNAMESFCSEPSLNLCQHRPERERILQGWREATRMRKLLSGTLTCLPGA